MPDQYFFQQAREALQGLMTQAENSDFPLPRSKELCQTLQSGLDSWEKTGDVSWFAISMLHICVAVAFLEERVASLDESVDSTSRSLIKTDLIVSSIAEKHSSLVDAVSKLAELTRNAVGGDTG